MGELRAKTDEEVVSFIDGNLIPPGAAGHVTGTQLEHSLNVIVGLTELSLRSQRARSGAAAISTRA